MPLNQRGDSGFTLAGFLILAALGASLWKGAPLESVRPIGGQKDGYEREYSQKIPARLWQDPFRAVYTHEIAVAEGKVTTLNVKSPYDDISDLKKRLSASDSSSDIDLTIVGVMLSPGSYPELEERRRRRRYAVLSGLSEESFVPRDPESLSFFYLEKEASDSVHCRADLLEEKKRKVQKLRGECFAVPFEWYVYENDDGIVSENRQVLLLWLDESVFAADPLSRTVEVAKYFVGHENLESSRISFNLLGPARSDALRNLVNAGVEKPRDWLCNQNNLIEFNIFSPTATVADKDLMAEVSSDNNQPSAKKSPLEKLQDKIKHECSLSVNFLRVIQSDEDLIQLVSKELIENHRIKRNKDHVVLISEWDTYFGRSLPRAFERHFCEDDRKCKEKSLLRYSYLRGIDGIVPGDGTNSTARQVSTDRGDGSAPTIDITLMRRPVGTGQFDYLRRLASTIKDRDYELRLTTGYGVRAVGLLGSDVYDKLLILRALRPELPGAIFFTTDLDAQLLHPSEYSWARGLMIATTYALHTSKNFKMHTMPFRDSYQTSVYLATRIVFNRCFRGEIGVSNSTPERQCDSHTEAMQSMVYKKIPPQIFEIGRQRLVPLNVGEQSENTWNYSEQRSHAKPIASGVIAIAILAIFALHQLRPLAGRIVFVSITMVIAFSLLGLLVYKDSIGGSGEPIDLTSGASSWPAVAMRVLAALLSIVFIWVVLDHLKRNWLELGNRFFAFQSEMKPEGITLSNLLREMRLSLKRLTQSTREIKANIVLPFLMIIVLMIVMRQINPSQLPLNQKVWLLIGVFTTLIAIWWVTIYGRFRKKKPLILSVNQFVENCPSSGDARYMWLYYGQHGATEQRFLRMVSYVILYLAFSSILFALLGPPSSPCRGELACGIGGATIGIGVLLMLITLFLVVDAARLCICWVDSMRVQDLDWSRSQIDNFVQTLRLPSKHAEAWIVVHLIGERTAAVTRLIYYPVIIILLMLLSRSTYFDNWDFPQALAIVIGLNFAIALGSIIRLNHIAKSVRHDVLKGLQAEVLAADRPASAEYKATPSERNELVKQLEALRIGAYLPVWDQPPVRATLMLLGGVALTYAEYLSVFVK